MVLGLVLALALVREILDLMLLRGKLIFDVSGCWSLSKVLAFEFAFDVNRVNSLFIRFTPQNDDDDDNNI